MAAGEEVYYPTEKPVFHWKPTGVEVSRTATTVRVARREVIDGEFATVIEDFPRKQVRVRERGYIAERTIRMLSRYATGSDQTEMTALASSVGVTVNDPARVAAGVARATQARGASSASGSSTSAS